MCADFLFFSFGHGCVCATLSSSCCALSCGKATRDSEVPRNTKFATPPPRTKFLAFFISTTRRRVIRLSERSRPHFSKAALVSAKTSSENTSPGVCYLDGWVCRTHTPSIVSAAALGPRIFILRARYFLRLVVLTILS